MWLSLSFLCVWLLIVLIYFPFTIIAKQTAIVPYDESNSSEFAVEENLFEKVVLDSHQYGMTFVGTIDGSVHCIDADSGKELWSFESGDPMFSSSVSPNTEHSTATPVFIPGLDGTVYAYGSDKKLRKLPVKVKDLVSRAPFQTNDGVVYTGRKSTRMFILNEKTGAVLKTFAHNVSHDDIDENESITGVRTLLIGRTDYHVSAIDTKSGAVLWSLSSGEYLITAQNHHREPQSLSSSVLNSGDQPLDTDLARAHQTRYPLVIDADGSLSLFDTQLNEKIWTKKFEAAVVTAHGSIGGSSLHILPHLAVPIVDHKGNSKQDEQRETFVDDEDEIVDSHRERSDVSTALQLYDDDDSDNERLAQGVVVVGEWANRLFALECPAVSRLDGVSAMSCESGDALRCLLGTHDALALSNVIDGRSQPLLPPPSAPLPPAILPHFDANDTDDEHELFDESWSWQSWRVLMVTSLLIAALVSALFTRASIVTQLMKLILPKFVLLALRAIVNFVLYLLSFCIRIPRQKRIKPQRAPRRDIVETATRLQMIADDIHATNRDFVRQKAVKRLTEQLLPQRAADGALIVGKLHVYTEKVLGKGSGGTVVYEGKLDGRRVAVKRLLREFYSMAKQEIELLVAADEQKNVVRYYAHEADTQFVYLALAYAQQTLADRFAPNSPYMAPHEALKIAKDICDGVIQLHKLNIIHRDLKPGNVLLSTDGTAKLSDMGLARQFQSDSSSFSTERGVGSVGWQAPELLSRLASAQSETVDNDVIQPRLTRQVDLFALGCLIFFTLTGGHHPFGAPLGRALRVAQGRFDLSPLRDKKHGVSAAHRGEARALVTSLCAASPSHRPQASIARKHPLFWTAATRLAFIRDASDRVEADITRCRNANNAINNKQNNNNNNNNSDRNNDNNDNKFKNVKSNKRHNNNNNQKRQKKQFSTLANQLEKGAVAIVGRDGWQSRVPSHLLQDANQWRSYRNGVRDLLRVVRNKAHHYRELPEDLKIEMGDVPNGYMLWWDERFPALLLHVWRVYRDLCSSEASFSKYFEQNFVD